MNLLFSYLYLKSNCRGIRTNDADIVAFQSDKRHRLEALFQDVSEREMKIQADARTFLDENQNLKVLAFLVQQKVVDP
jgi:hypothetical protein